ncbi:YidC family membrane integrase SpoIIIJ [Tuberibacillus sp. Marseille-P3662]|uniref:YidC family membrane integrase SpoIIIJ n=1 Tax=Tuberibacillus sp. Marseille-P3662 TaxID=1965358 RepID=UPI000A1CDA64|nr:YidC family membrane integrase SpoIIIJ [Tuberibacillus sp. Marseille-P3662]
MRRKIVLITTLLLLVTVLAGCGNLQTPITSESEGFWNEWFIYPLSAFITYIAGIFNNSYGLAIIICTILVRLLILPLMIKQTKSSKAMQEVQPEIKKLREKYSSKDAETQKKLQEETMKLFQQHKVNPLAGCFPIIIQMPILIAFYQAVYRTEAIKQHEFLWFSLGQPDYILPIIAALFTFAQQKLMMGRTGNANPQMAMMMYIFPVMIAIFGFYFPSALALYWVVGNLFMIIQTYFITAPKPKEANSNNTGGNKK